MKIKSKEKDIRRLRRQEVEIKCDMRVKKIDLQLVREQLKLLEYEPKTNRAEESAEVKRLDTEEPREVRNIQQIKNSGSGASTFSG